MTPATPSPEEIAVARAIYATYQARAKDSGDHGQDADTPFDQAPEDVRDWLYEIARAAIQAYRSVRRASDTEGARLAEVLAYFGKVADRFKDDEPNHVVALIDTGGVYPLGIELDHFRLARSLAAGMWPRSPVRPASGEIEALVAALAEREGTLRDIDRVTVRWLSGYLPSAALKTIRNLLNQPARHSFMPLDRLNREGSHE